jgi:DNA-binding NarL/FixJ family response regulator
MTSPTSWTRIVVASADSMSRATILVTLRAEPGFNVIGEACDEPGLLALRRRLQPDILLLDLPLAALVNGTVSSWPAVRIILLANIIDEGHIIQALRLGARAIVPKTAPAQVLLKSIRKVLANEYWLGSDSTAIVVQMLRDLLPEHEVRSSHQGDGLTAREHNIVAMVASGHSNKQIGHELLISERTVKHHLTSIFGKLGLSSRLQLATFAAKNRTLQNDGRATLTVPSHSAQPAPQNSGAVNRS